MLNLTDKEIRNLGESRYNNKNQFALIFLFVIFLIFALVVTVPLKEYNPREYQMVNNEELKITIEYKEEKPNLFECK